MPISTKSVLGPGLLLCLAAAISGCGSSVSGTVPVGSAPGGGLPPTAPGSTIRLTPAVQNVSTPVAPAVVADLNGDGWLETVGTANDGAGNLLPVDPSTEGLDGLLIDGRPDDLRVADFNGDGSPDLIAQGYSSTDVDTRALLYFDDGTGHFQEGPAFAAFDFRGRGEGLVVADFNNDGYVDIFLPYYDFEPCTDPECPNAPQAYLLLNDGTGHFREAAAAAGVDFTAAPGIQPEGAEAADIDDNGLVDLYVGGHLLLNESVDANGVPHFQDCSCGLPAPPAQEFPGAGNRADEGFKFLDWNNDGLLDMVVQNWGGGPPPPFGPPPPDGPTLYHNVGTATLPSFVAQSTATDGTGHPFFSTGAPDYQPVPFQSSFGLNAYDLNNDGREDIITAASGSGSPAYPATFFRNTGHDFEQLSPPDVPQLFFGQIAFGDINRDGKIDVLYSWPGFNQPYYLINQSPARANTFVSIEMLGPTGERNQQGRVVRVRPQVSLGPQPVTYTRVVDGGSGYHAQSQYALLVGTPYPGPHSVSALYGNPGGGTTTVTFTMDPGQYARVFAPSAQNPGGRVLLYNQVPPPLP